jgi:hypothetical protein
VNVRHDLAPPPRRLSVGEPGWRRFAGQLRVLLDGEEVERCTAYDLDKQIVSRQLLDASGRIYVDRESDRVACETVSGKVEVKWR